jgi:hypothetical protein
MFVSAEVVAQVLLLDFFLERGGVGLDVPVRPINLCGEYFHALKQVPVAHLPRKLVAGPNLERSSENISFIFL